MQKRGGVGVKVNDIMEISDKIYLNVFHSLLPIKLPSERMKKYSFKVIFFSFYSHFLLSKHSVQYFYKLPKTKKSF